MGIYYAVAAFVVLAIIFIKMTVVIIPQSETRIVERLGKYYDTQAGYQSDYSFCRPYKDDSCDA